MTASSGAAWLVVAMLAVAGLGWPGPAQAAEGACSDPDGVTVVVDFQSLGGPTLIRCAAAPVSSGFDALTRADIAYQTVAPSPGFICRIEGLPADQTCADFAPADAYWSYWTAERGGGWSYSAAGAGNRVPPAGTVEGWSFSTNPQASDTQPPRTPPPAPPQPAAQASDPDQPPSPAPSAPQPPNHALASPQSATPDPQPGVSGPQPSSGSQPPPAPAAGSAAGLQTSPPSIAPSQGSSAEPPVVGTPPTSAATDDVVSVSPPEPQSRATSPSAASLPPPLPTPGSQAPAALQVVEQQGAPPTSTLVGSGLVLSVVAGAGVIAWRRRNEQT